MNRREGRICAFELLFETDFRKEDASWSEIYESAMRNRGLGNHAFVKTLYQTAVENQAEIDKKIEESAENWRLSRMSGVTRAVLRLCVGELLYTDVPPKVAINEAVEISKLYNDEKSTSFVNGILNKIATKQGALPAQDGNGQA